MRGPTTWRDLTDEAAAVIRSFFRFVTVIGFTCMANNLAPTSVTVGTCGLTPRAVSEVFTFTISRVTGAFIRTSRAFGGAKNMREFFCKCLLTPL